VVAYELFVDAEDRETRTLVQEFSRPLERTGRKVTPDFQDWVEAAEVVTAIEERDRAWRSKLPALLSDILIALSARDIGATIFAHNRADVRLIRRYIQFPLHILEA